MAKFEKGSTIAAKAGAKSKPGKHIRTKQWEALSDKFCGEFADDVINYLEDLRNSKDPKDKALFFEHYKSLLNYFKPKMQHVTQESEQKVIEPITFVVKK